MLRADSQPGNQSESDPITVWWVVLPQDVTAVQRRHLAHQALRDLLADYLGVAASEVLAQRDEHGKPHLVTGQDVSFSLSHSGRLALVAMSPQRSAVGADVQMRVQLRDASGVAKRIGGVLPGTVDGDPDAEAWHLAVCRAWVCKEAAAKALGTGLATPLRAVVLQRAGQDWCWRRKDGDVWVRELEAPTGAVAALAVHGPLTTIDVHHYPGPASGWDPTTALIDVS